MLVAHIIRDKGAEVFSVDPSMPLADACGELNRRRIGALVVCEAERVVGVISERDVVRAVAVDGPDCLNRTVGDYMTREVVFAAPSETIDILMTRMTDRRIRHLPVLDNRRLVGVVSIGDVVKRQIARAEGEAESLRSYIAAG